MRATSYSSLDEAERLMTICNACRYCEGLCAVFPAMERRRTFAANDLNYLANLCHACGACYFDCQFSPPHEFKVNVPKTLTEVRANSYSRYAWPFALAGLFERNGVVIAVTAALSVAGFIAGFVALNDPSVLLGKHTGPGSFYRLMPHDMMVLLFGGVFIYAIIAALMGLNRFWRDIDGAGAMLAKPGPFWQAVWDASRLRYLDGGGVGCMNKDERPSDNRRIYHHLTFYGFMLCFAATCVATVYHYGFGLEAPYGWFSAPVVLGTVGGIGLLIGPLGLLAANRARDEALQDKTRTGMDTAFLLMLFLTSLTGLALLGLRETEAMGLLLALHLGVVFALFLTMPYGKFVHGIYRFAALVRYAKESREA